MLHPAALDPAALPVPLLGRLLPAGFPSPADDYLDGEIDLGAFLIERPASTFLMRVAGESMKGAGILDGDMPRRRVTARPVRGRRRPPTRAAPAPAARRAGRLASARRVR